MFCCYSPSVTHLGVATYIYPRVLKTSRVSFPPTTCGCRQTCCLWTDVYVMSVSKYRRPCIVLKRRFIRPRTISDSIRRRFAGVTVVVIDVVMRVTCYSLVVWPCPVVFCTTGEKQMSKPHDTNCTIENTDDFFFV